MDDIENREATVQCDLAVKDIRGRILFSAEIETKL